MKNSSMNIHKHTSTKQVAVYWNMRGETYSRSWSSVAKKRLNSMELKLITNLVKSQIKAKSKPIKVLDIGIAIGRISNELLKYKVELYGTDISKRMVDICKKRFNKNRKVKKLTIHDIHHKLPEDWGKFDLVTGIRVISYSPQWKKELKNIYTAMKPGGFLIFSFPNRYSTHMVSTKLRKVKLDGCETTLEELNKVTRSIGFSNTRITGFSRLLDSFYDWADTNFLSNCLFFVEKILERILGKTLFVRLFYVVCQK